MNAGEYRFNVKRQLVTLLFLLMIAVPGLLAFAPPLRQDVITMAVNAGYDGYYRHGQWVPLQISVSNSGDDLTGYIRVRTGDVGGLEEIIYRTPIDLPRDARKQVFLYVSPEDFAVKMQVEVVDRTGRIAAREDANLNTTQTEDLLVAVVTASAFGAVDLTALVPGTGDGHQTNWRIEDIPTLSDALAGLDVMMFHDVDTGDLSADQQTAVLEWVLAGGHLIVAGGESWQRTTAGLEDLLPVTLRGTVPIRTLAPLAEYLHLPADSLDGDMTATDSEPNPSADVLVRVGETPLIVRQEMGGGLVDFLAIDPNAEPLRSWADKQSLWYTLIASMGQRPVWGRGFSYWGAAREATLTTFSNVLPTFFQLCGFLLLYIALLGPVNYIVLRRLNRREWAWFTIPILIVIFSVLAYQLGFNLRGNVPTVNRLTVVRVWPDTDKAQVMSLIGVQSPRRDTYDITVERGYSLRVLPEEGVGLNVPSIIDQGTQYAAKDIPIDAGTIGSFVASGFTDAPDLDASATWSLSGSDAPRITGRVTNTLDVPLKDPVVLFKGGAHVLETLDPGETATFEIALGPGDPAPLTLGNAARTYPAYNYNYGGSSYWSSSGGPGWCFKYQGLYLTIPDVMQGERFSCGANRVTADQQEIRRRYRLLSALIMDTDLSGGRGSGAYLFAWTDQPIVGVELNSRIQNEEDTTLYIFDLALSVEASGERVEVPPALTTWSLTETDDPATLHEITPTISFQVTNSSQAAFQFMPLPDVRLETVEELVVNFQGSGSFVVELWNWRTQRWNSIRVNPDTGEALITEAGRYAGPENAVNVRIRASEIDTYNQVRTVMVAYHGRLAG